MDRLMAIFYSIVEGKVVPTANIFSQVRFCLGRALLLAGTALWSHVRVVFGMEDLGGFSLEGEWWGGQPGGGLRSTQREGGCQPRRDSPGGGGVSPEGFPAWRGSWLGGGRHATYQSRADWIDCWLIWVARYSATGMGRPW